MTTSRGPALVGSRQPASVLFLEGPSARHLFGTDDDPIDTVVTIDESPLGCGLPPGCGILIQ